MSSAHFFNFALVVTVGLVLGCPQAPPTRVDSGISQNAGPDAGCDSSAQCSSGLCVGRICVACQNDLECGAAAWCNGGVCVKGCSSNAMCESGQDCCGTRCVDLQRDPAFCGACTRACADSQFCGRGSCHPADFSQLCQLPITTVVFDEVSEDDDAGFAMGQAIVARCNPNTILKLAPRDAGLIAADGLPLARGELLVVAGGSFAQRAVRWAENTNSAQVSDRSTSVDAIYALRDGGVVSSVPRASLGPTLDRLVLQVVRAPTGSLMLNAAGYHGPGTLAAAGYFVTQVLPQASTLTTRWYVVEWEDSDGTSGPSAGDRYTVISSGS